MRAEVANLNHCAVPVPPSNCAGTIIVLIKTYYYYIFIAISTFHLDCKASTSFFFSVQSEIIVHSYS